MKMNQYGPLLRLALKLLKYFLLMLFGFVTTYTLSVILGVSHVIIAIMPLLLHRFFQFGTILLCLLVIALVLESLR